MSATTWKYPMAGAGIHGSGQPVAIPRPNPCRDLEKTPERPRRCKSCGASGVGAQWAHDHAKDANCPCWWVEVCE
jgi:hypothetical protein